MTNDASLTEDDNPSLNAVTFSTIERSTTIDPGNSTELDVGGLPSVVYRITAPAVDVVATTVTAEAKVPPAGLIDGGDGG
jgi:hypothetical protein